MARVPSGRRRQGQAAPDGFWRPCLPAVVERLERVRGTTMVIDKGLPPAGFRDLLRVAAPYVDLWKLGFGTVALYPLPVVREKVRAARAAGVEVYVGGTFLELARRGGRAERALELLQSLGMAWAEVSDGTYPMTADERRRLVGEVRGRGFEVITEVGSKDPRRPFEPQAVAEQIAADLEAGARRVLVEGRDSGEGVGIYDDQGRIRHDRLEGVLQALERLGVDARSVVWEAPRPSQQKALLVLLGPEVGLGNVQVGDILTLAAMRRGLRSDTLQAWWGADGTALGVGAEPRDGHLTGAGPGG